MLQLTDTYKLSKSHPKPAQISPILIKLLSCSCLLHLRDKPSQSQPPLLQQRSGTNKPPHADPRALPELAKTRWPHHRQSTPAAGAKLRLQVRISLFFSTFAKPKASPASHAVLRVPFLLPRFCTPSAPHPGLGWGKELEHAWPSSTRCSLPCLLVKVVQWTRRTETLK